MKTTFPKPIHGKNCGIAAYSGQRIKRPLASMQTLDARITWEGKELERYLVNNAWSYKLKNRRFADLS